jgi:hypothetical protein
MSFSQKEFGKCVVARRCGSSHISDQYFVFLYLILAPPNAREKKKDLYGTRQEQELEQVHIHSCPARGSIDGPPGFFRPEKKSLSEASRIQASGTQIVIGKLLEARLELRFVKSMASIGRVMRSVDGRFVTEKNSEESLRAHCF